MACLSFTLYFDESFPRNWWANDVRTLTNLCTQFAGEHYSIELINMTEHRERAVQEGVFSTPTVLLELEGGRKLNLGNFPKTKEYFLLMSPPKASGQPNL